MIENVRTTYQIRPSSSGFTTGQNLRVLHCQPKRKIRIRQLKTKPFQELNKENHLQTQLLLERNQNYYLCLTGIYEIQIRQLKTTISSIHVFGSSFLFFVYFYHHMCRYTLVFYIYNNHCVHTFSVYFSEGCDKQH